MRYALIALLLAACGGSNKPEPVAHHAQPAPATGECVKSGCSGTVCTEPGKDVVTTCEMKAEYACYGSATCERQKDGACGWTQTPELTQCLASPPPLSGGPAPQ